MQIKIKKTTFHILIMFLLFVLLAKIFFIPWIIGDGLHYYATLRSVVIDKDINFANEYSYLRTLNQGGVIDPNTKTITGMVPNQWSVGNAIFWSPFFLIAHLIEIIGGKNADGYSQIYFTFVTIGTLIFSFMSLILIYNFLKKFVDTRISLMTTIFIFIGSTIFYYTYHDPSMSHIFSLFAVTSFIYYWYITSESRILLQHIILGFLGGLILLTRWQDGLFLIMAFYDLPSLIKNKDIKKIKANLFYKFIFILTVIITFLPQMIFWKIIYGSFITIPPGITTFYWYPRYLVSLFFSTTHGLFIWTPIIIFSFIGLFYLSKEKKKFFIYLVIPLTLQILFTSSISSWHGAWSYGIRMLTSSMLIFAIGLAYLIKELNKKVLLKYISIVFLPFILWNLLLMAQVHYYHPIIDPAYPFSEILINQIKVAPKLLIRLITTKLFGIV